MFKIGQIRIPMAKFRLTGIPKTMLSKFIRKNPAVFLPVAPIFVVQQSFFFRLSTDTLAALHVDENV